MKAGRLTAIVATGSLALLAIVIETLSILPPARLVLGILLVFALPGFSLVCAALPAAEISTSERILASIGVSVATTTCSAVLLGATVGLSQRSAATMLGCLTVLVSVYAWHRTYRIRRRQGEASEWQH